MSAPSSPAKHRVKTATDSSQLSARIHSTDFLEDTREHVKRIDDFPTTGKAGIETILNDMLVNLWGSLHSDIGWQSRTKYVINATGGRVNHKKDKLGKSVKDHNELVDSHNDMDDDLQNFL